MRKIQELRLKKGLSRNQVANYCGVNESTVLRWETVNKQITVDTLVKLAKLYDTSIEILTSDFAKKGKKKK